METVLARLAAVIARLLYRHSGRLSTVIPA